MSNKAKLTAIRARIAKLQEEEVKLAELAANEVDTDVVAGSVITFKFGRAEKARNIEGGLVLGVKGGEGTKSPTILRVQFGTGADTDIVSIFPSQVLAVTSQPAAAAE
jgi:hypothetical protein